MGMRDLNESVRVWWTEVRTNEKARSLTLRNILLALGACLIVVAVTLFVWPLPEKERAPTDTPAPATRPAPGAVPPKSGTAPITRVPDRTATSKGKETVEADISTRSVSITSNFSGTEIVIFGAVDDSRQDTAEAGIYDVVVVVEGTHEPLVARRKSKVMGIWINTDSVKFSSVPSYYAIASTRPIEEVAAENVLRDQQIGLDQVPMVVAESAKSLTDEELAEFRDAVIRIKKREGLFQRKPYGVAFIGKALFRTTIDLPANVPVGPLRTKVYLFRDGNLLADYEANVTMQRAGVEAFLHTFAFERPLLYGLFAVFLAVTAGLIASAFFRRGGAH